MTCTAISVVSQLRWVSAQANRLVVVGDGTPELLCGERVDALVIHALRGIQSTIVACRHLWAQILWHVVAAAAAAADNALLSGEAETIHRILHILRRGVSLRLCLRRRGGVVVVVVSLVVTPQMALFSGDAHERLDTYGRIGLEKVALRPVLELSARFLRRAHPLDVARVGVRGSRRNIPRRRVAASRRPRNGKVDAKVAVWPVIATSTQHGVDLVRVLALEGQLHDVRERLQRRDDERFGPPFVVEVIGRQRVVCCRHALKPARRVLALLRRRLVWVVFDRHLAVRPLDFIELAAVGFCNFQDEVCRRDVHGAVAVERLVDRLGRRRCGVAGVTEHGGVLWREGKAR
mmetsp:Transcript_1039/g.2903  ORF Transcript_1039/g.2903 Transcript_1039/m.2903 type:complete len:348 (+) Transcript_1039:227-1270(+)